MALTDENLCTVRVAFADREVLHDLLDTDMVKVFQNATNEDVCLGTETNASKLQDANESCSAVPPRTVC